MNHFLGQDPIEILPITGGNSITVNEYLRAINQSNIKLFQFMLIQLRYERNLFTIEGDEVLKKGWLNIETCLYWQGVCAIQRLDDKIITYQLSEIKVNNANEIISAKGTPYVNQYQVSKLKNINLTTENAIFFKRNQEGYSDWIFYYYDYIRLIRMFDYLETNLEGSQKKIAIMLDGAITDEIIREIKELKNPHAWWIGVQRKNDGVATQLGESFKELNIENDQEKIWYSIEKTLRFLYFHKGRRYNTAAKEERNLVDEVQLNTVNFDLLEKDKMDFLQFAIDEYNTLYGQNASIIKTFETLKPNSEIEMENESIIDANNLDETKPNF